MVERRVVKNRTEPSRHAATAKTSVACAFTLVELLVVLAVIGVVVSVLLPGIGRARDQGRLVVCRSNLRSIGLLGQAYAGDHNGLLPTEETVDNPQPQLIAALSGLGYTDAPTIYYCPSEKRKDLRFSETNFEIHNISYFYYSFSERPTSRYLSNFLRKNVYWPRVLKDTMAGDMWLASDSWFSNLPTAHKFYKKGVNYVTLDGSVQMVKASPRDRFR